MGFRAKIAFWAWVTGLLAVSATGRAETNAASAFLADAQEFFAKYRQASQQLQRGKLQEAAITMDLLSRSVGGSPWIEIALLKRCQLIEPDNDQGAEEDYNLLRKRLANAPYFQGDTERARLFGVALQGAVDAGITRIRIRRVRAALQKYHAQYLGYPESLLKLSILGYIEMQDIHDAKEERIRYVPEAPEVSPFITYRRFELQSETPIDPFVPTSPRLESVSQISEQPPRFSALVRFPGRAEPTRLETDQTVQGFYVAAVAPGGAVLASTTRLLVLLTP